MSKDNTQQVKSSRSTSAQDAKLFRHNKHLSTDLPALPTNSNEVEWETIRERTVDSTVSPEEIRQQAWVLDLRGRGYSLNKIVRMTGVTRALLREWEEYDVAFRTELEHRWNDFLDEKVERLIPMAEKTLRGRHVRTNRAGQKMYDRAEQEAVRLVADVTMKIAGKVNPEKWGGVEADTGATVLLQINIPAKQPQLEGALGEWGDDEAGRAARAAALAYADTTRRVLTPTTPSSDSPTPPPP